MIVPEYWAEAREQVRHNGRRITVRRYGWSDDSADAAQAHAEQRPREALEAILAGQQLPRREQRTNYGVAGVPIREQIVARHDDVVITRNSYGALCLNTPDVLFADVDLEERPVGCSLLFGLLAVAAVSGFFAGVQLWNWMLGIALAVVAMVLAGGFALRRKGAADDETGAEARALARIEAFSGKHPDWHLRLYRTPAGLRLLAMHRCFDPQSEDAALLFQAVGADRLYATMCKLQCCFRARLTAKPWRIGISQRITPPVAAWSAEQARLPARLDWIARYEAKAKDYAACRFLKALGGVGAVDPRAEQVRALHDVLAGAASELPLA